jgi:chemotaxis protein histidine kinase CheA
MTEDPSQNDLSQDAGLVQDFLVECEELLQGMDQDMVALESSPQDADLLNRIFRAMHTIKGTSSFLGFEPIVRLSHHAEDVLNSVRRGETPGAASHHGRSSRIPRPTGDHAAARSRGRPAAVQP